jgi:hypothetical protein
METSRRLFLGRTFAAAVPLAVGIPTLAPRPGAQASCASCDDPVAAEALRQLKAAIRGFANRSATGEHGRQAAGALRIMVVHSRAQNADARFRRVANEEIRIYGRDNVLIRPFDQEQFASAAREFGVAPELRGTNMSARRQALDSLLQGGVTPHLLRAAEFFEAAGATLDDDAGHVRRIQITKEQQQYCAGLRAYVDNTEAIMTVTCLLTGISPACGFAMGVYIGARLFYNSYSGCNR